MDLQLSRQQILLYWAGPSNQHRQNKPPTIRCALGLYNGSFFVLIASDFW